MNKRKIWVVSELFYPDDVSTGYIMTQIAKSLSADAEVHVICGPAGYDSLVNEQRNEEFAFAIHRTRALNFNKNNVVGRLFRLLSLSIAMFVKGWSKIGKEDSVFIVTNPAFSIPLFSILKSIKGFRYTILVHDVFPENLISGNVIKSTSNLMYRLLEHCFNWSYKKADHLIVLGRDMREMMNRKVKSSVKISVVENWADLKGINPGNFDENEIVINENLKDKIVFLFAGNMGRLQGLDFLFNIIKETKNELIHFVFIGNGAMLPELKEFVLTNSLKNVSFLGTFPRDQQNVFLNACHFGLVTLEQNMYGLGVPSKSYNIMAAGKPIFFIGNKESEIALMIKEHTCGVFFDKKERSKVIEFFNSLSKQKVVDILEMGGISRKLAETNYSEEFILAKFNKVLLHDV